MSGLRRPDGVIVASLIEPRTSEPDRVAGPVQRDAGGALTIGALRLTDAEALPLGRRALVTGTEADGALRVTNAAQVGLPFPPGLKQVSIEAYIGRTGSRLDVGSGYAVAGHPNVQVPRTGSARAVLTATIARDGDLTVERLRIENRIAPEPPQPDTPRFERERDRLDLRNLPDEMPGRFGAEPGGRQGGPVGIGEPHGPAIDTRPGARSSPARTALMDSGRPAAASAARRRQVPERSRSARAVSAVRPGAGPGPGGGGFGGAGGFGGPGGGRR
ncbi:hypothetical protein [Methylobacterium tardum]|uniref:hypothetical protein n=1 Tax=Methylobacterium tardum TaxID=374432 RepID=UPI003605DE7A